MNLKNFSLITRNQKVELNATILLKNPKEELALPLKGKTSRLTRNDFLDYFPCERLQISPTIHTDKSSCIFFKEMLCLA
jgi:serine/threonine-protein kinase HipA